MMFTLDSSLPAPLRAALARLRDQDAVLGALLIGSLPAGAFTAVSDYDLIVVLDGLEPLWYVGVTTIGGRFADIIVVAGRTLEQIVGLNGPVPYDHSLAPVLRWVQSGAIVLERGGALRAAQAAARERVLLAAPTQASAYSAWFNLNYNFAVVQRILQSEAPLYLAVADIRMAVYAPADLWFGYFAIRGQPWSGDKAAVRALEAQDPHYLGLFQQFVVEGERSAKARRYAELAALAAVPLGGLWQPGWTGENLAEAPVRVAELLGESDTDLSAS